MGGAVSSFLAMSLADVVGILQQWKQYNRDEAWSKREHDIGLQSMRIDILNTVREEMRDQVTVIISSLDNLMVVATLMLSIGFGFVVEGTFPPAEENYDYSDFERFLLVVYAVLCALALVFPLACLMLTIAARFEVEMCHQDVMGDLQQHLLKALKRDDELAQTDNTGLLGGTRLSGVLAERASINKYASDLFKNLPETVAPHAHETASGFRRWTTELWQASPMATPRNSPRNRASGHGPGSTARTPGPRAPRPRRDNSPQQQPHQVRWRETLSREGSQPRLRRGSSWPATQRAPSEDFSSSSAPSGLRDQINNGLRRLSIMYTDTVGHISKDEVRLVAEGLLQKVTHYHNLYPIAQTFLWLGMHSSVLVCTVMLGLYFKANYPSTPWMWRCYSGILGSCALLSMAFLMWMKHHILKEPIAKVPTQLFNFEGSPNLRESLFRGASATWQRRTRNGEASREGGCFGAMTPRQGPGSERRSRSATRASSRAAASASSSRGFGDTTPCWATPQGDAPFESASEEIESAAEPPQVPPLRLG